MQGPLSGVRVVDLTSVVLGPLCTQILGDLGADVIKVEAPSGDTTRLTGPQRNDGMAALFMGVNRNKRSVVLDLKTASGRLALARLIATADVFIHSIRPQKIDKLGLSEPKLRETNPRIVYCGLHGYRSDGPYSGQPAYDDVIQGQSGAADLMARLVGVPRYFPTIIADKTVALMAAYAIGAALFQRERTGEGQFVEVPMFECMAAFNMVEHLFAASFEPSIGTMGYSRVLAEWRRPYETRDGYICMLAYTDPQWRRFWSEVGCCELADDPRFDTLKARSENIDELYRIAGQKMRDRTTDDWIACLNRLEIPTARITRLEELFDDPHLAAIDFFKRVEHPTEGRIVVPDAPVRFSRAETGLRRLQPTLGEHSAEVLGELGYTAEQIAQLHADGVTRAPTDKESEAAE